MFTIELQNGVRFPKTFETATEAYDYATGRCWEEFFIVIM